MEENQSFEMKKAGNKACHRSTRAVLLLPGPEKVVHGLCSSYRSTSAITDEQ
jgi:hypothetical protein